MQTLQGKSSHEEQKTKRRNEAVWEDPRNPRKTSGDSAMHALSPLSVFPFVFWCSSWLPFSGFVSESQIQ
jgi:hypothetical protein